MGENRDRSDRNDRSPWTALGRKLAMRGAPSLIALTVASMIGLSACGSGSRQTSGVASLGTTTSTTTSEASAPTNSTGAPTGAAHQSALGFAECMRAHGIADFPDPVLFPGGGWGFELVGQVNQTSPSFQAANQACKSHAYGGIHPCGKSGGSLRSSSGERRC